MNREFIHYTLESQSKRLAIADRAAEAIAGLVLLAMATSPFWMLALGWH